VEFYPQPEEPDADTLREAAESGDTDAMVKLAKAYEYGMNGLPQSSEQARYFFQQAFEHGKEDAVVFVKQMDEEDRGDPELLPLTWDNKRLIARLLHKHMPRTDALHLSDEHVLEIMKDAGLPKTLTGNIPENSELALFGVKYAWAKHSQYECGGNRENA
jgi:TPR repeat protein